MKQSDNTDTGKLSKYAHFVIYLESKKSIFLGLLFPILYITIIYTLLTSERYVSKINIQNKLITAISNEASLEVIKNIYANREIQFTTKIFSSTDDYYKSDTALSKILSDITTRYYLDEQKENIDINKTNNLISKYSIVNPFDSLEVTQKSMFVDIGLKLQNDSYAIIQSDLEKIAKELFQKNSLVNQYLKDSTNSFWISISALVFSAMLGFIQLYYGREEKHRQIISDELKKHKPS